MGEISFTVHTPATTANLGPGFDCLAVSLDLWNSVTFSESHEATHVSINGEGEDSLPRDRSNLILETAHNLAQRYRLPFPENIHIACQNEIPTSSGLGSSASAVVTGLVGARKILNLDISDQALLEIAAGIEGHADNAAACLMGGLVLINSNVDRFSVTRLEILPISTVVAVPDFSLTTKASRKALPDVIPMKDAIFNIASSIELIHILQKGNYENLAFAMRDRLHQKYRQPLLPGAEQAMHAANSTGAYGACISGAGPGVIAFSNKEITKRVGESMRSAYEEVFIRSRILILNCPSKGTYIS